MLIPGGMAYEIPRATTEAAVIALKALLDPRKMQPKTMTSRVVNPTALSGTLRPGWTFAKNFENGMPRSRAKAYVIRLLVVIILMVALSKQINGKTRRQMEPALLPVAW